MFADRERPSPGLPNRMSVPEVILPDGTVTKTVATAPSTPVVNRQQTGAFVLWKGFGKKKIRKSQRNRPAGWHGNHPEQKPMKVSRETLNDIPEWTPLAKQRLNLDHSTISDDESYEKDIAIASLDENFAEVFPD
jgi:hypothetical protein